LAEVPDTAQQAQVHYFEIEAQPMPDALDRFSEQSDMRILYPYLEHENLRSNRVDGHMTTRGALSRLIAGTPLEIVSMRGNVAVLRLRSGKAAEASTASPTDPTAAGGLITVTGRRLSEPAEAIGEGKVRQSLGVSRKALLSAPPGISGLMMLDHLPGLNVQTDGPLGLYELGNSVQVRAFNLDQIGFVVDGVPLGRSDVFGGSPVFRYVENENLAKIEASPGGGQVASPSYSSLGPIVTYSSIEPEHDPHLFVSQSFGSDGLKRTFVRASSGEIGPMRAYLSRGLLVSDLWRGAGTIDREHWEAQAIFTLTSNSSLSLKFLANDFLDYDSPFLTRSQYESTEPDLAGATGRDRGFVDVLPDLPETVPGIRYSNPGYADYFGNAINSRNDRLYSARLHISDGRSAHFEGTFYREDKDGFGVSPDIYQNSLRYHLAQASAGLDVSPPRGVQWGYSSVGGHRTGVVLKGEFELGDHMVDAGLWLEDDRYRRQQYRLNKVGGAPDGGVLENELVYYRRDYRSRRKTMQFWARDRWTPMHGPLTVELAFKGLKAEYSFRGYRDFDDYAHADGTPGWGPQTGNVRYFDGFEPSLGMVYRLPDERTQIFTSYAETFALPKSMDAIAATAFAASPSFAPWPKPERARNLEFGVRTNQPRFFAVATLYFSRFTDLINSIGGPVPGAFAAVEPYYQNVGSVTAHGLEATASIKPALLRDKAYFTTNLTYNRATFAEDLPDGTAIEGNRIPDSARWLVSQAVTVEPASWLLASLTGKYTSRRYADFTNTQSVAGQLTVDAYVEVSFGKRTGPLKDLRARVNFNNLFDKDDLSFILPTVAGEALYRPRAARSVQFNLSGEF
jgi:iron complex outermembrane receptor protein